MKKLLGIFVVLAVVVAGGVYWFASSLNGLVQTAIETVGSQATKTDVSVGKVDINISPSSASAEIQELIVPNPAGFSDARAFELGKIRVSLNPQQVSDKIIHIREVLIEQPEVTYEFGSGDSNFVAIQKNVEAFVAQTQKRIEEETGVSSSSGQQSSASSDKGASPKIIIDKLSVLRGEVAVVADLLGSQEVKTDLPDLVLTDIGKDKGGASPEEVAALLIDQISVLATKAVASIQMDAIQGLLQGAGVDLQGLLGDGAGNIGAAVEKAIGDTDAVKKVLEGAGEGGGDAVKKVLEGAGSGAGDAGKAVEDAVGGALKGLLKN